MTKAEDFLELVNARQSVRSYLSKPVEQDKLDHCIEAARLAPSACNAQPWKFIIVSEPHLKESVAMAARSELLSMNHFALYAPVLVVVVMEKGNLSSRFGQTVKDIDYPLIDIGIATAHFCLQASSEGLGTCILGWFDARKIKKLLSIPSGKRAMLILTIGYPSIPAIRPKKRKRSDEISSVNRYQ
jgi:nitroreductase